MISMTLFFNMAMAAGNVFLSPDVASPPKASFDKLPLQPLIDQQI